MVVGVYGIVGVCVRRFVEGEFRWDIDIVIIFYYSKMVSCVLDKMWC